MEFNSAFKGLIISPVSVMVTFMGASLLNQIRYEVLKQHDNALLHQCLRRIKNLLLLT
jgi:hypothetical protein